MGIGIWYKDLLDFLRLDELPKFIPTTDMKYEEQLNAVLRFAIYLSLVLFLVKRDVRVWYITIFIALLTIGMYEFYSRNKWLQRELYKKMNIHYEHDKDRFCSMPTKNNPFMNPLVNEIAEFPNRPPACDMSNGRVQRMAESAFENNLYRDVDDIWSRKSSSRNWHTLPSTTIPNDSASFANWLYKTGPTCKEGNGQACFTNMHRDMKM